MGLILDTSVFVSWERSGRSLDFSPWATYGEAAISVMTASELLVGVYRADTSSRRKSRSAFVEAVLARVPILSFTTEVARVHAELFALLLEQGQMIGAHDLIIAATAIYHQHAVLTLNVADFQRVSGLNVLDFSQGECD